MKKRIIVSLLIILVLVGCQNNNALRENETSNQKNEIQDDITYIENIEDKNILSLPESSDNDITIDDYNDLKDMFTKKWVESYESSKLVPIDNLYDENLSEIIWYLDKEFEGSSLMFFKDGRFLLCINRFGEDVIGNYQIIDEDTIHLIPSTNGVVDVNYYEEMTLSLKRDTKNIFYTDMLILDGTDEVFYSLFSTTEVGTECLVEGYEVIKTDRVDHVIINRTNLKEKPDINSNNAELAFTYMIDYYKDTPEILENYYTKEELQIFENLESFIKGMPVSTLARSTNKYLVEGVEDYWYYVSYYYFEGVWYEGWIHGSCLEPLDENKTDDYIDMFIDEIDSILGLK